MASFYHSGTRSVELNVFCETGGFAEIIENGDPEGLNVGSGERVSGNPDLLHVWRRGETTYFGGIKK